MTSPQRLARTAGLYYLVVAVCGGFAHLVRTQVYVAGDAATTLTNVAGDATLVRLSFAADLVSATFMVFLVLALFRLLAHADRAAARLMVTLVAVFVAMICLNLVGQWGALQVATDPAYAGVFGADGPGAMVLLLLDLQHAGYLVAQVFFGLWLWPLGTLVLRSRLFPRVLGVALKAATVAYLVDVALQFLAPDGVAEISAAAVVPVVVVGEVSLLVYLLVHGVRTPADTEDDTDRILVSA
jgi:Domain of unknown function (DUF4386)